MSIFISNNTDWASSSERMWKEWENWTRWARAR